MAQVGTPPCSREAGQGEPLRGEIEVRSCLTNRMHLKTIGPARADDHEMAPSPVPIPSRSVRLLQSQLTHPHRSSSGSRAICSPHAASHASRRLLGRAALGQYQCQASLLPKKVYR